MRLMQPGGAIRKITLVGACALMAGVATAQNVQAGQCVTTETMAIVFVKGTPQHEIDRIVRQVRANEAASNNDYEANARWILTSYGNSGSMGSPVKLGYSFVPDGVEVPDGGLGGGPSNLQSTLTSQFGSQALWRSKFRQMFDGWEAVCGNEYVEVPDDGASLHFWPGQLRQRGDLRISGLVLAEPNVLAYNFFPDVGDMVINTFWDWGSAANDYRFFRNTMGHEHGHGMGLGHTIPLNDTKLMEPALSTAFDGPQSDDIQGAQFLYGDVREENDFIEEATDLGVATNGMTVNTLAIERHTDHDWFVVGIPENFSLNVTLEPVGSVYMVGPQGGTATLRDSRRIHDLRLRVYQTDGVTPIGVSNVAGPGFPESITSIARPASGAVAIKVDVTTTRNDIQRFRLVFGLTSAANTYSPTAYTLIRGIQVSGGLAGIQQSDDFRLRIDPDTLDPTAIDPVQFTASTFSETLAPSSLVFGYEGASSSTNVRRRIELWDFTSSVWVQIDSSNGPVIEQTFEFNIANPARYVSASGEMRSRISCQAMGPIFANNWEVATDHVYWRVGN